MAEPVFEVYVLGDNGSEFDSYLVSTMEVGKAVAAREYSDYYSKPIEWKEPLEDGSYTSGVFSSGPRARKTVVIARREVLTS